MQPLTPKRVNIRGLLGSQMVKGQENYGVHWELRYWVAGTIGQKPEARIGQAAGGIAAIPAGLLALCSSKEAPPPTWQAAKGWLAEIRESGKGKRRPSSGIQGLGSGSSTLWHRILSSNL